MEQEKKELLNGRYRMGELLGTGTSAKVYRAVDTETGSEVAIKLFEPAASDDEEAKRQFDHEVKIFALLDTHPNIVSYYGGSTREDCRYIVMELATGSTLAHLLNSRGGKLPVEEALSYFSQVLKALSHVHGKGVIHRDIKPQNVRILDNGLVKLVDFGIATLPGLEEQAATEAKGTVNYISPEQAMGRKTDARSDLYSAGVMLYEMLTGELPFTSDKARAEDRTDEIIRKHLKEAPVRPTSHNPNIPTAVEQIVRRALNKNPANRFQSAEEMLRYIRLYHEAPHITFQFELQDDAYDVYDALPEETDASRFCPKPLKPVGKVRTGKKAPVEEKSRRTTRFMTAIFLLLLVAFLAVGLFSAYTLFWKDDAGRTVITVGELLYDTCDEDLVRSLEEKGYEVKIEYRYSGDYPAQTILEQEPAAYAVQKLADDEKPKLTLVVSGGCRVMLMNDYAGKDFRQVKGELEALGYTVQVEKKSSEQAAGEILSTSPKAGDTAIQSDPVILYVSSGEAVTYRYVPNLVGLSYGEALVKLEQSGIKLSGVSYRNSDAPAGEVIAQSCPYGDRVAVDFSGIELTVSRGFILE